MASEIKDTAGVIAAAAVDFPERFADRRIDQLVLSVRFLPKILGYSIGGILIFFGIGIILHVKSRMAKAETNIEPWKPTTAILSDGIYGISRNPIYVAMTFIYVGVVFVFNSLWMLPPLLFGFDRDEFGVILREEKYLEQKFGAEYLKYKKKVRRWI